MGFEMGCIICFPTSAPSAVYPIVQSALLQTLFPAYRNLVWSVRDVDVEDGPLVGDLLLHACLSPLPAPD